MAFTISNETSANSIVSGATLTLTVSAVVGAMLLLGVAADNAGTLGVESLSPTVTDSAGNFWVQQSLVNQTAGVVSDGATLGIYTCLVTSALTAGTVTVAFSPDTTAKCAVIKKIVATANEMIIVAGVGAGAKGSAAAWAAPTVSVTSGDTIFGFVAVEATANGNGDTDTVNGNWSATFAAAATTGVAATSMAIGSQQKTVNATGNQTFDGSGGAARDYAINYIILSPRIMIGTAAGVGAATGSLTATASLVGTAAGTSTATGSLTAIANLIGTAAGSSTANAILSKSMLATIAAVEPPDRFLALAVATWPASLPSPTVAGFSLNVTPGVARSAMDYGAARAIRKGRRVRAEIEVAWQLDGLQQMTFDAFYRDRANEGGAWFAVTIAFPVGFRTVVARFFEKVSMKTIGGLHWRVTAKLEVLDRPCMTADEVTAALDDAGDPPAWPESLLPKPLRDSWALEPKPIVARSDDMPGLPQARRRSLDSVTTVDSAWELTPTQAALFDGFYRWRSMDGAQWFKLPVFAGIDLVLADARFTGDTVWKPHGGIGGWRVSATVEIRQRFILSSDDLAEIGDIQAMLDVLDRIHQDVNDLQAFYDSQFP